MGSGRPSGDLKPFTRGNRNPRFYVIGRRRLVSEAPFRNSGGLRSPPPPPLPIFELRPAPGRQDFRNIENFRSVKASVIGVALLVCPTSLLALQVLSWWRPWDRGRFRRSCPVYDFERFSIIGGCQRGVWQRGVLDLAENRLFSGSGRPRGALKPSKKVGGFAHHLFGWL